MLNFIRKIWSHLTNADQSVNTPLTNVGQNANTPAAPIAPDMPGRGTYQFEVDSTGNLVNNAANLDRLFKLFRDSAIIDGKWGPGRSGDFEYGSWHILCHLAAGSGVYHNGSDYLWVSITHDVDRDEYVATVSAKIGDAVRTVPLNSTEGISLIANSKLLGFVEGSSQGHILARNIQDPPTAFNSWPRQSFNRDIDNAGSGGTVWELWCPTRDIRQSCAVGCSVVSAYLSLVSTLGGKFVSAVARGRRGHDHPRQLCALVEAGFLSHEEALWDTIPNPLTTDAESLLKEANQGLALQAVENLQWDTAGEIYYYMFQRKIDSWSKTNDVKDDLRRFS